ncbi:hypothetical protein ACFZAM_23255 [Streptomyces sp. NPDC008079]|uniref:hypothetical protein n=1 Tax=Streptomyces sp. NPDC008079 TaxID=3364806 RepID=UPI0036E79F7E
MSRDSGHAAPGCREVRVELLVGGDGAPFGGAFADEHLSVRWDDARCVPWRDSADVLWHGLPLPSRAVALAWTRRVFRRHPGVLAVCAGYGGGGSAWLAAVTGAPPLTVYASGPPGGCGTVRGGAATAAVGSLLHACAAARLPLNRPLLVAAASREPGGAGRWAVHLVPEPTGGSGSGAVPGPASSSAIRAVTRSVSEAPTLS